MGEIFFTQQGFKLLFNDFWDGFEIWREIAETLLQETAMDFYFRLGVRNLDIWRIFVND